MEMTLVSEVLLKLIEDIKVQCHVILNACGRMRRARASKLYCNISFVKYSIMVTIVARVFKQVLYSLYCSHLSSTYALT